MIIYRQASRWDMELLQVDENTSREIPDFDSRTSLFTQSTEVVTIYDPKTNEIHAVMGIDVDGKHGSAWAVFSKDLQERGVGLKIIRLGRRILEVAQLKYGLLTIDMAQRDGNVKEQQWAKLMGFKFSELVPDFMNGHDYRVYEREWS